MRVLVVYCHPVETSFAAALHAEVVQQLRGAGHEVDDCDLYAEGFNPVMSREERLGYHDVPANRAPLQGYIDRLHRVRDLLADGLNLAGIARVMALEDEVEDLRRENTALRQGQE